VTTRTIPTALREVTERRELLVNLTRRELRSRYRRSFLGWGWSFMQPVLMTAVYALVLGVFLGVKPEPGHPSGIDTFAFFLLAGVIPWTLFAMGLTGAIGSVANAGGLITRVWFPRELLPLSTILALGVSTMIELGVLVAAETVFERVFILHLVPLLPILVLLLILYTAGIGFWLAACNVKFKDVEYLTGVVLLAYFYVTPILYPVTLIPDRSFLGTSLSWRDVVMANPMARFVMAFRNVLYDGRLPTLATMVWLILCTALVFGLGLRFFSRRAERFAEAM
jgi:ABC-2 type transport system permease protein